MPGPPGEKPAGKSKPPVDNNRSVLRWPLFLPSGDIREIQVTDIAKDNRVIGYSSFPRAGTMYGLDILRQRVTYLYSIATNYIALIFATVYGNAERPPPWKSNVFPVVGSGIDLLEFEYENYSEPFNFDAPRSTLQKTPILKSRLGSAKHCTASQLIFGFDEREHDWIRPDINISSGRLDGITHYHSSYYSWLGEGPDKLYREYRIDEKWVWNCYATEIRSAEYDKIEAQKFFDFALENGGEYLEEWKLVIKSAAHFNQNLFSVFNVNPKRSMAIFENYNFRNHKSWHNYKPLHLHKDRQPGDMHTTDVSFFEDDLMPTWQGAVDNVIKKIKENNGGQLKAIAADKDFNRLTTSEITAHVLTNYHQFVEYCNENFLNIHDFEKIKHIPEYIEFAKGLQIMAPCTKDSKPLYLESVQDYYELLCRIELFATSTETGEKKVDESLEKLLTEASLMRNRFISVVNLFKYRSEVDNASNKAMLTTLMMNCLNHKKELSFFEKNFITMVDKAAPKNGHTVLVLNFHASLKEVVTAPQLDPTLQIKELKRSLMRNCNTLKALFKEIQEMSFEQGFTDFTHTTVL